MMSGEVVSLLCSPSVCIGELKKLLSDPVDSPPQLMRLFSENGDDSELKDSDNLETLTSNSSCDGRLCCVLNLMLNPPTRGQLIAATHEADLANLRRLMDLYGNGCVDLSNEDDIDWSGSKYEEMHNLFGSDSDSDGDDKPASGSSTCDFKKKSGIWRVSEALKSCRHVSSVRLSSININCEGFILVAEALKSNQSLSAIDLSWNKPTDSSGIDALADALLVNTSLTYLNLQGNIIHSLESLAAILENSTSLLSLIIGENTIHTDFQSSDRFVYALKSNRALTNLGLHDEDGVLISDVITSLTSNQTLQTLSFWRSGFRMLFQPTVKIAQMLKVNQTLIALQLSNCFMDNTASLFEIIRSNRCLKSLNFSCSNLLSPNTLIEIASMLREIAHSRCWIWSRVLLQVVQTANRSFLKLWEKIVLSQV
jgi:hypothetical protein